MAKLTKSEQDLLDKLNAKVEAPDRPTPNLNVTIDLGDDKQVALARKHGWLDDEEDDSGDGDEDDDSEGDETPKRKGYFKE